MSDVEYRLGLDPAGLATGLTRAQAAVRQATGRMQSDFGPLQNAVGSVTGAVTRFNAVLAGVASIGALAALRSTVSDLAALDDAAESTGASVEELSSLLNTLAPSGVGLDTITLAMGRLVKAMTNADDEAKGAGAAFKALGIQTRDANGNLRPTQDILEEVARELARYEDGSNKTALAVALFGKSGAQLLPMLKDLATTTREAGTVTGTQAAEAERLEKAFNRLTTNVRILREELAAKLIPGLADVIEQFNAVGRAGGSMWERIRGAIGPDKYLAELAGDLADLQLRRDRLAADKRPLMQRGKDEGLAELDRQIVEIEAKMNRVRGAAAISRRSTSELRFGDAGYGPAWSDGGRPPPAPKVAGEGSNAKASPMAAFVDANTAALQELGALFDQAGVTVAAKQQDLMQRLDKMFFDGLIGPELYEGAMQRLYKTTATVGKDGVGELDKKLEEQAEQWRGVIEPMRRYTKQLEEIRNLVKEGKLTASQGIDAEFSVENARQDAMDKLGGGPQAQPEWLGTLEGGFRRLFDSIQQGSATTRGVFVGALEMMGSALTGVLARMSAEWIATELGFTAVKATQAGVRAGIDTAAAATSVATNAGAASTNIMASAWEAMAGAFKALVGIPYVGPVLAPAAAAGAFATVSALASRVTASAEGGYDIPGAVNPITQLHAREMVLPAKHADVIRGLADGGPGRRDAPIHVNVSATDAQSVQRLFMDNTRALTRVLRKAHRNGGRV
jgi:hypothetical protein